MLRRGYYFFDKALGSIRESPWVSALTTLTIAVALLVLGLYALAVDNLTQLAMVWGRTASVSVYISDAVTQIEWASLQAKVAQHPKVEKAVLVSPREALARFRARGPSAAALVEGVNPNVLPASVALTLKPGFTDLASLDALAKELGAISGVSDVDYGKEDFDRLAALLNALRYGGIAGALLIGIAVIFIVANTIRLTVYARRDEVGILGLVGATAWFIRIPFIIEGALWGTVGGLLAAGTMWLFDRFFAPRMTLVIGDVLGGVTIRLYAHQVSLGVLAAGAVLGALASGLAVRRFLDAELR